MKLKLIASLIVGAALSMTALADMIKLKEDHPQKYTVKKGDTLWDISAQFLNSPWLWPRLWQANSQIENPHLIYPGDVLTLIWVDGQPQVVRKQLKKLSPTPRLEEKHEPVPTIPLTSISPFLSKDHIIDPDLLKDSPRLLGDALGSPRFFEGDTFYGQGKYDDNKLYGVYRLGKTYYGVPENSKDDEDAKGENLGTNLIFIGHAEVSKNPNVRANDKVSPLDLVSSPREARQGDLILPIPEYETLPAYFIPQPVSQDIKGHILGALNNSAAIGQWDVVVIDKGKREGIQIGSMFSILRAGPEVLVEDKVLYQEDGNAFEQMGDADVTLPDELVGELMVFKVYEKVSIAIVMRGRDAMGAKYKIEGLSF